ncbi:chitooligosaccharidolytic beta-N-acetylglucosaminidase-like isoform X2 [Glossina fuscipes]|uniref:beta-N-acetylhexosaminidase n=1 Tax=Glossina fuscipes TaxID=7396 RepID=A0A9C5Z1P9_9MUSC|nr:chitooligosaccharidolytic beta-N-acetylglucosaminidase-like isoform X2 [Glossina fuscipes]
MATLFILFGLIFVANIYLIIGLPEDLVYGYECIANDCVKFELNEENLKRALSLPVCYMLCSDSIGTLWPKPNGKVIYDSYLFHIDLGNILFNSSTSPAVYAHLWKVNEERFAERLQNKLPDKEIKNKDAMAMVKLNTFHWHIIDSQSFPMEIKARPELHKLGAYSQRKVYTHRDITEIVEYGRQRGIRIMPEFDAPAHVCEGWQNKISATACFKATPWSNYCPEPPCGQLDPTINDTYSVLQDIYQDMFNLFDPDVFHMGGDEVFFACWSDKQSIADWMTGLNWDLENLGFTQLWGNFQMKAMRTVDSVAKNKQVPIILWTSLLTDPVHINRYLNKRRYIIQIWTEQNDSQVLGILERGFRIIVSNSDALYFDCGGSSWLEAETNWCSPYNGWQRVYENKMENIAKGYVSQVLGAEAAVWSEQIDEQNLDQRLWPRASALAERLWSNPSDNWQKALARLRLHRENLVKNGIAAEPIQPEWCLQNPKSCLISSQF